MLVLLLMDKLEQVKLMLWKESRVVLVLSIRLLVRFMEMDWMKWLLSVVLCSCTIKK